jgi:hypothetical protein
VRQFTESQYPKIRPDKVSHANNTTQLTKGKSMTTLNKPVRRSTASTVFERGHRRIVVTLYPQNGAQPERIGFRLERQRREWTADLQGLYDMVIRNTVLREQRDFERRVKELVKGGMTRRAAKRMARLTAPA